MTTKPIYLDYNATTPVDPRVLAKMTPYFSEYFGNPSSQLAEWGWTAEKAVQKATVEVAELLGARPHEIFFTSGATESNNWVFWGLLQSHRAESTTSPLHILTTKIEHNSVLNTLRALVPWGIQVEELPVNEGGFVDVETLRRSIRPNTRLISIMWVNNEIGTINNMEELGQIARENKIYFHTDATQAVGKLAIHLDKLPIDLLSFSGHKIYGPKGVGCLYIRSQGPKVTIAPLFYGGGQQRGLRSGTHNVPGIVGLGAACKILEENGPLESRRIENLRNLLWAEIKKYNSSVILNGPPLNQRRICNNLNIRFPGTRVDTRLSKLKRMGISTGSACGTGKMSLSHVLQGIGLTESDIVGSLRLSLGRPTTEAEILEAGKILGEAFSDPA